MQIMPILEIDCGESRCTRCVHLTREQDCRLFETDVSTDPAGNALRLHQCINAGHVANTLGRK